MKITQILDYEIKSSWWAPLISCKWMQEVTGSYYAWKTIRKYRRYLYRINIKDEIKESYHNDSGKTIYKGEPVVVANNTNIHGVDLTIKANKK